MKIITDKKDRNEKMPRRWKQKVYSKHLVEYVSQLLKPEEKIVFDSFFNGIVEEHKFETAADLMLLDTMCFDFIRIKRLQRDIAENGDTFTFVSRTGIEVVKVRESSYLLNAIESQFRSNLKELMLTRKEQVKKTIGTGGKDFANWLSTEVVDVEEVKDDGKVPSDLVDESETFDTPKEENSTGTTA